MELIAEKSGQTLVYERAGTFSQYRSMIEKGEYDILLTYPYRHDTAREMGIIMSKPYLEIPLTLVTRNGVDPTDLNQFKEAQIKGFDFGPSVNENIVSVSSVKDALHEIDTGKADYFYGIGAMISYYSNQERYNNIQLIYGLDHENGQLSFGIKGEDNAALRAIINKALQTISDQDIENFLYTHTYVPADTSLEGFIYAHPMETFMFLLVAVVLIAIAFYKHYVGQLNMKKQIEMENNRYRMLAEISGESIFEYNYHTDLLTVNGQGFQKDRKCYTYEHLLERVHQSTEKQCEDLIALIQNPREQCELLLMMEDGVKRWHRIVSSVMKDAQGNPIVMIGRIANIHEEMMERERLRQAAEVDQLTNMYNSDSIRTLIEKALSRAISGESAILIADMDNFKEINDRYGHYQGDRVLQQVGEVLNKVFAPYGLVGRLGGDEFLIYLENLKQEAEVLALCKKLSDSLKELPIAKELNHSVQISIGYVMITSEKNFYTLYKQADRALYRVKETGRNGISKYTGKEKLDYTQEMIIRHNEK